jgi:hypothetical protein
VVFVPDHAAAEALFVEVALARPTRVEPLRVQAREPVHAGRDPLALCLDQEMEVRVHQAPGMQPPSERAARPLQQQLESQPVGVVEANVLVAHAMRRDVEDAVLRKL